MYYDAMGKKCKRRRKKNYKKGEKDAFLGEQGYDRKTNLGWGGAIMISGRQVVQHAADALGVLAESFPESFPQAIQALRQVRGKIICSGVGKSGHVARKVAGTLASTGSPALFVHATEAVHGDLGVMEPDDALIVFSNSGETPEVLRCVHHSACRLKIVVTSRHNSSLAFCCDVALILPEYPEACPLGLAPTTSCLMMMALGDSLALTLTSLKGFGRDQYRRLHPGGALGHRLSRVDQMMRAPAPLMHATSDPSAIVMRLVQDRIGCVGLVDDAGQIVRVVTAQNVPELMFRNLDETYGKSAVCPKKDCLVAVQNEARSATADPKAPCVAGDVSVFQALKKAQDAGVQHLFVHDGQGAWVGVFCADDGRHVRA